MNTRYFSNWSCLDDVHHSFGINGHQLRDKEVLFAWYGYGDYYGEAKVIFQRRGKLYEVAGSHCSCNGLEGQWQPELITWEQLALRPLLSKYKSYDDPDNKARDRFEALVAQHVPRA